MSVVEALLNLVFAPITTIEDVKASGNWMWAAKLPAEVDTDYMTVGLLTNRGLPYMMPVWPCVTS